MAHMYGYKVKINCLPELLWASEITVTDYHWQNRNKKDMLELSLSAFEEKTVRLKGKELLLRNHALSCVVGEEERTAFCRKGTAITVVSVAVKLSDFYAQEAELTAEDGADPSVLLLPAVLETLSLEDELEVTTLLHKLIRAHTDRTESGKARCLSGFFELLAKVDGIVRKGQASEAVDRRDLYIHKANSIIASRYAEKITLSAVADQLHISPGYLSAIYKKVTGMTFSEYLLNTRMKHADKMLMDQNIPTAKVAALLGFCDENHFRKKFKQFFGMNVREYRNIKNGLTLYHKQPLRKVPQDE